MFDGFSPLETAFFDMKDVDLYDQLISMGIHQDSTDTGGFALIDYAAVTENIPTLIFFLKRNASWHHALDLAITGDCLEVFDVILDHVGVEKILNFRSEDFRDYDVLEFAKRASRAKRITAKIETLLGR